MLAKLNTLGAGLGLQQGCIGAKCAKWMQLLTVAEYIRRERHFTVLSYDLYIKLTELTVAVINR